MDITQTVAAAVRGLIAERGMSELSMAQESGIPRVTLRRRLAGQTAFTVQELADVGRVLDITVLDIVKRSETVVAA